MKELYEVGIVFRGFILVNHSFSDLPEQKNVKTKKEDLRGAFISAISSFAESAFNNNALEYLESGNILFIFKMAEVQSVDYNTKEPIILYGLVGKRKKKVEKTVKKFLEKSQLVMESFIYEYNDKDFTELDQFKSFKNYLRDYFGKKQDSII